MYVCMYIAGNKFVVLIASLRPCHDYMPCPALIPMWFTHCSLLNGHVGRKKGEEMPHYMCTCGLLVAKWKCEVGAHLGLNCALRCLCACLLCFLHAR